MMRDAKNAYPPPMPQQPAVPIVVEAVPVPVSAVPVVTAPALAAPSGLAMQREWP